MCKRNSKNCQRRLRRSNTGGDVAVCRMRTLVFTLIFTLALVLLLGWQASLVSAQKAPQPPQGARTAYVRLEVGGHTGLISQALFLDDNHLITVGHDKTVRQWLIDVSMNHEVAHGAEKTYRFWSDNSSQGCFWAAAVSKAQPSLLAVAEDGGARPWSVLIVDAHTGALVKRLIVGKPGADDPLQKHIALAFSPDGSQLAVCCYTVQQNKVNSAAVLYNVPKQVTGAWNQTNLRFNGLPLAVGFSGSNPADLAVGCLTKNNHGEIEIHRMGKEPFSVMPGGEGLGRINCLVWSNTGVLAVADALGQLAILKEGKEPFLPASVKSGISSLAFSPDGARLAVGVDSNAEKNQRGYVAIWSVDRLSQIDDPLQLSGGGPSVCYNTAGVLVCGDAFGNIKMWLPNPKNPDEFERGRDYYTVDSHHYKMFWSKDGNELGWQPQPNKAGQRPVWLSLTTLSRDLNSPMPADRQDSGLEAGDFNSATYTRHIRVQGLGEIDVPCDPVDQDKEVLRGPGASLLVAKGTTVEQWDVKSQKLVCRYLLDQAFLDTMTVSEDRKYLAVRCYDLVTRIWKIDAQAANPNQADDVGVEPMLCLYFGNDIEGNPDQWIIWNPEHGYFYSTSPIIDESMEWQINPPALDDPVMIAQASICQSQFQNKQIVQNGFISGKFPLPQVAIYDYLQSVRHIVDVKPADKTALVNADGTIEVYSPDGVVRLQPVLDHEDKSIHFSALGDIDVSSRLVQDKTSPKPTPDKPTSDANQGVLQFTLHAKTAQKVTLIAMNKDGDYTTYPCMMRWVPPGGVAQVKGRLLVLAIGINTYGGDYNLKYCENDATEVAAYLNAQGPKEGPGLYTEADVKLLVDKDKPDRARILQELDALKASAQDNDTVVLFVASHGYASDAVASADPNDCFLVPFGALPEGNVDKNAFVSWSTDIIPRLNEIRGNKILFIDHCVSGKITQLLAEKMKGGLASKSGRQNRIVALVAGSGDENSFENANLKHGLFTQALLDVLRGGGVVPHDGNLVKLSQVIQTTKSEVQNLLNQPGLQGYEMYPDDWATELDLLGKDFIRIPGK